MIKPSMTGHPHFPGLGLYVGSEVSVVALGSGGGAFEPVLQIGYACYQKMKNMVVIRNE